MLLTWLKTALLCFALVAGGLAVAHAAPVVEGPPAKAAQRDSASAHVAPEASVLVAASMHDGLRHDHGGPDRGCPQGGDCCDAFCYAILAAGAPAPGAVRVSFAAYDGRDDAVGPSLAARGPDRPPRPAGA